jgi:peptidoglycan/LPS O-acetylase OafA/YrhL
MDGMRERCLDGLRGWAALIVFAYHIGPLCFGWPVMIGGVLPPVIDGALSVEIFFVLSGYVLSVEFYRTGQRRGVLDLALRRYPRLTVPTLVCSFAVLLLMRAGLMFSDQAGRLLGSSWLAQRYAFTATFADFLYCSTVRLYLEPLGRYNAVLWTMYYELLGSFVLFALLLAVGRSERARLAGHGVFVCACWMFESPLLAMALGAVLAHTAQQSWWGTLRSARATAWASAGALVLGVVVAALRDSVNQPVRLSFCGALVVIGVLLQPGVRTWLAQPLSQELGHYSFPIYLVHVPVLCSVSAFGFVLAARHGPLDSWVVKASIVLLSLPMYAAAAWGMRKVEVLAVHAGRAFAGLFLRRAPSLPPNAERR